MKMNGSVHSRFIGINHRNELAHKLCEKCNCFDLRNWYDYMQ